MSKAGIPDKPTKGAFVYKESPKKAFGKKAGK